MWGVLGWEFRAFVPVFLFLPWLKGKCNAQVYLNTPPPDLHSDPQPAPEDYEQHIRLNIQYLEDYLCDLKWSLRVWWRSITSVEDCVAVIDLAHQLKHQAARLQLPCWDW